MSPVEVCDPGEPEAVVTYPMGVTYQVRLAGTVISRHLVESAGPDSGPDPASASTAAKWH